MKNRSSRPLLSRPMLLALLAVAGMWLAAQSTFLTARLGQSAYLVAVALAVIALAAFARTGRR